MKKKTLKGLMVVVAGTLLLGACGSGATAKAGYHTYNTYLSTNPTTWNVHDWETNDQSYITSFTEMGLYDLEFRYDAQQKPVGYNIIPEMAAAMPVDVSSTITPVEKARFGYSGNVSSGLVWDIELNPNACWEDGVAINADTYVESMKLQLDPHYANFRADSYYQNMIVIANAEKYYKQGRETIEPLLNTLKQMELEGKDLSNPSTASKDGHLYLNIQRAGPYAGTIFSNVDYDSFYIVLNNRSSTASNAVELAAQRITDACQYYMFAFTNHEGDYKSDWDEITSAAATDATTGIYWTSKISNVKAEMMDYNIRDDEFTNKKIYVRKKYGDTYTPANLERYTWANLKDDLNTFVRGIGSGYSGKVWAYAAPLFGSIKNTATQEWDGDESGVGLVKMDEYKIRMYLTKVISLLDLKFALCSNWIVNVPLYNKYTEKQSSLSWSTKYANPEIGVKSYKAYGPYKLTKIQAGKSFLIEKNPKWYGYSDGKHVGQFTMDAISTRIITEHSTVVSEFMKGRLDDIELTRNDMKNYGTSSRLTQTWESYTQKISFNSDRQALAARQSETHKNKTALANFNLRKGLSLGVDRKNFAAQATAGSKGFTGLLNDLYLSDNETGMMYRNTEQGKSVYPAVYGKLGGNPYAADYVETALDENSCGYNFNMAVKYVTDGLKEELASTQSKHLMANDTLDLEIRVYDKESEGTVDAVRTLNESFAPLFEEATKNLVKDGALKSGEKIDIQITSVTDIDYYNTAKTGKYDLIFSTWGGAAINPVGLMQVYCDNSFESCCEYGFKGKQGSTMLEIEIDGVKQSKSFHDWYIQANNISEDKESQTYEHDHKMKLDILAGLEAGILNRFEAVPIVARASSSINSFKIENGSKEYINLMGYGGVRYMTFNYDDAEWAQFLKEHTNLDVLYKA